jgi:hypothetical protein
MQRQRAGGEYHNRAGHFGALAAAVGIESAEFDQGFERVGADQEVDRGRTLPLSMAGTGL